MRLPYMTTSHGILFDRDCLEILGTMKDESVDCVFADPPFNIGKDYKNGFNDVKNEADYFDWCSRWIRECSRIVKPGGAFFLYALPQIAVRFAAEMHERLSFRHWIAVSMKGTYPRGRKLYPATTPCSITPKASRRPSIVFGLPFRPAATAVVT